MRIRRNVVVIICEFDYLCKSHPLKMLRDLILYTAYTANRLQSVSIMVFFIDILKLLASSMCLMRIWSAVVCGPCPAFSDR